jgi:hypothetical protein
MPPAHFQNPQPLRTAYHKAAASHTRPNINPPQGPTCVMASRSRLAPPSTVHHRLIDSRSGASTPASEACAVTAKISPDSRARRLPFAESTSRRLRSRAS